MDAIVDAGQEDALVAHRQARLRQLVDCAAYLRVIPFGWLKWRLIQSGYCSSIAHSSSLDALGQEDWDP
jgi:hypothetical protein